MTSLLALLFISNLILGCIIYLAASQIIEALLKAVKIFQQIQQTLRTVPPSDRGVTGALLTVNRTLIQLGAMQSDILLDQEGIETVADLLEKEPPPNEQMLRLFEEENVESTDETKIYPSEARRE